MHSLFLTSLSFHTRHPRTLTCVLLSLLYTPILLAADSATPSVSREPAQTSALKLDAALISKLRSEAQNTHPSVAAARARLDAAAAAVRAVRLYSDPELRTSFTSARQSMRKENGDVGLGLEMNLPRTSLYAALKSKAQAEERVQKEDILAAQALLGMETAKAVVELALTDEALVLEAQQVEWVKQMAANAQERAKDPKASTAEALRIESEFLQESQRQSARQQERQQRAKQLNLLLGRPVAQPWPTLALPQTARVPDLKTLLPQLAQTNPRLQALRHTASAAEAESTVTRLERQPKVALSLDTNTYSGGDLRETIVGLKVTLPWFNERTYQANSERASSLASAAQQDRAAAERELQAHLIAASKETQTNAQQAKVYADEVIPAAAAAVDAVTAAWISSKATLLEVLEARRSLLLVQLEERRFVAANRLALESIHALVPDSKR